VGPDGGIGLMVMIMIMMMFDEWSEWIPAWFLRWWRCGDGCEEVLMSVCDDECEDSGIFMIVGLMG